MVGFRVRKIQQTGVGRLIVTTICHVVVSHNVSVLVVVPVCHHDRVVVVVFVRLSLGTVNNEWCPKAINILTLVVSMQPIGSPLLGCIFATLWRVENLVVERVSIRDRALCHTSSTIVVVYVREEESVCMQCGRASITKLVGKVDVDKVVRVDREGIGGELAIDADGSAREFSTWIVIIDPANTPLFLIVMSLN